MQTKRILVFSSAESELTKGYNDNFIDKINEKIGQEVQLEWHNFHDICLKFSEGTIEASLLSGGEPLDIFDFVYFKSFFRYSEQAATIVEYLKLHDVPFVSSELSSYIPLTKLTQFARMARAGIPIAPTIYLPTEKYLENYENIVATYGSPFIFKATNGATGRDNYLIATREEFMKALGQTGENFFVAQKFIQNENDLRVLVLDSKVEMVIERTRTGESHLNNTSQGGSAVLKNVADYSEADMEIALHAARVMGREVAGVDLMHELGTGKPYILEVNASPQIGTGAFMDEKIEKYCQYFKNRQLYT